MRGPRRGDVRGSEEGAEKVDQTNSMLVKSFVINVSIYDCGEFHVRFHGGGVRAEAGGGRLTGEEDDWRRDGDAENFT
ncbi:MAG: hypothetical protein C0504_11585 [Candidatus Solibacter sp.]|nr:hypothetical protein [Candidatus Solibacter sp.]